MAIDMADSKLLLKKISEVLKSKHRTLKVDGRKGPSINFEQLNENQGDQLFKHPVFKEIENIKGK